MSNLHGATEREPLCLAAHPEEHVCDLLMGHDGPHLCGEDPGECDFSWPPERTCRCCGDPCDVPERTQCQACLDAECVPPLGCSKGLEHRG